jgi:hypothetical protein
MYTERRWDRDVLWMIGITDLIKRIDQGTLAVRLERNTKVNGGAGGRMTLAIPLIRNGAP